MILVGAGRSARWAVVTAIVAALALAGCSSPKQSATSTSAPTTTTTTTTTTTPLATTTTTTVPGCTGANYTLSLLGTEGAAGTNEVTFGLRNTSSATCVLFGYPGVELLGAAGAGITTNDVRGGTESFTNFPAADVSVPTGATAYFNIGYSDVVTGGESSCPTTTGIQVIPPNTTTELKVAGQFTVCNGGTVDVSPVFGAGSSETQTTAPPQA